MKTRLVYLFVFCLIGLIFIGLVYYAWIANTGASVVVEWSTASELDTVGFNIYRSETSSDPGTLVNIGLISASEDTQTGGDYKFTDDDVISGRVYYYYLEDVSANGITNRHGPVQVKAQPNSKLANFLVIGFALIIVIGIASRIRLRFMNR